MHSAVHRLSVNNDELKITGRNTNSHVKDSKISHSKLHALSFRPIKQVNFFNVSALQ